MAEEIKVYTFLPADRTNYQMRYRDPYDGKERTRSAGCRTKKEAERAAAVWEDELRRGVYVPTSKATWQDLVDHYVEHVLPGLGTGTATTYLSTFNVFGKVATPARVADFTTNRVTRFVAQCRENGLSDATIARHLRTLKVLARWAHGQGILSIVPKFEMPKRAKGSKRMKGRPVTLQEFNEMLAKVPAVLPEWPSVPQDVDAWRFYLKGLWCSGLRLGESLALRWDDAPGAIVVDYSRQHPLFRIPAEAQKSGKDQMLPMVPEFARLLGTAAPEDRSGPVFAVGTSRHIVGKVVSAIGQAAGVVVDSKSGKFASAHDLRRSFGSRWSRKVMPAVLKELMRHANVATTLDFYVGDDAQRTAAELWGMETPAANSLPNSEVELGSQPEVEDGEDACFSRDF
ncbi:tyrosine-type recombinase/integrase [Aeoliella sp. ICT_H6.2]|uniref:Tyrosine-type recombinase/integrase n=1 Tax=Aeoliella straminimaris TaxID=2954799 RepID=A0A9X2F965_9BACT|nr:site-specific integrase [Aeoliella straminimaris]MCO6044702.1 tyrosine-type recombinase/integrase [Aeoliella straminimaris]